MSKLHIKDQVAGQKIHIYDIKNSPYIKDGISYFALTDSLLDTVGQTNEPLVHFWPTDKIVFLGAQDTRLPYFKEALTVFDEHAYDYIVRNSGGLGVVSDEGIINVSIILPNNDENEIKIDDGFTYAFTLLEDVIGLPIRTGEIPTSYCPGDYDVSINGKKICGISQRRRANAVSLMFYISIDGDQRKRGLMMHDFYKVGLKGQKENWPYETVDPDIMINLNDALDEPITIDKFQNKLVETLKEYDANICQGNYDSDLTSKFNTHYQTLQKRNDRYFNK